MENNLIFGMSLVILSTLIGSLGALFFKYASANKGLFNLLKKPILYFGFIFYGVSALIFVFALTFGDLSSLYPLAGLNYIWVSLLSMKFLKENMNDYKWFGIIMILSGVILIGLGA